MLDLRSTSAWRKEATRLRRAHLDWISPALLMDWIVVYFLSRLADHLRSLQPYERDPGRYQQDESLSWPRSAKRVHDPILDNLALWLPAAVVVLASMRKLRLNLHELHHGLLALNAGRALTRIIVEWLKNRVGRLRPDFLERCAYSVVERACTGKIKAVADGRRSFPSGHSASAFQRLFFVCLFIAGRSGAFAFAARFPQSGVLQSKMLRLYTALAPLALAAYICNTRLEDHRHHLSDVLVGSVIGILASSVTYLIYFPSPFSSSSLDIMHLPRLVYSKTPSSEGAIHLEEEDDEYTLVMGSRGDSLV